MFNRKPCNLPGHKIPPWLQGEDLAADNEEDEHIDVELDGDAEEQSQDVEQCPAIHLRYNAGDKVYVSYFTST